MNRAFRWLWLGQLVSNLGTQCSLYGIGLWMFRRHGRLADFALVALVVQLARIAVLPVLPTLLARWPRRRVLVVANGLGTVCTVSLAGVLLIGGPDVSVLPVLLLLGAAATVEAALVLSVSSLIPQLLGDGEAMVRANGLFATTDGLVVTIAPFLGAWLGGGAGLRGVLALDGLSFLVALFCVTAVPWPARLLQPMETMAPDAGSGMPWRQWRRRWHQVRERAPLLMGVAVALVYAAVEVLFPAWVVAAFGAQRMGPVLLCGALGYATGLVIWQHSSTSRRWGCFRGAPLVQSLILMGAGLQMFERMPVVWFAAVWAFTAMLPLVLAGLQTLWCRSAQQEELAGVFALRYAADWLVRLLAFALAALVVDPLLRPALLWPGWPDWISDSLGLGPGRPMAVAMGGMGWLLLLTWLSQRRRLVAWTAG